MSNDDNKWRFPSDAIREGATDESISDLERCVGKRLPATYVQLMKHSNGVECFLAEQNYLVLWPAEQLVGLNEAYCVAEFAPGLLLIGSDGADLGYAFDTRREPMPIVEVPLVGISHHAAKDVASNVEDFLGYLRRK